MSGGPDVSVVVPIHNEQANIQPMTEELAEVLQDLGAPWEIIFVDDGSTDESGTRIAEVMQRFPPARTRLVRLEENLGQSAALWAGFGCVRSDVVITMDADLQNDPADIPRLLATLGEADAVIGWRHPRSGPRLRKVASRVGNAFCRVVTGVLVHDTAGPLRVLRKECLPALRPFKGLHRFIPVLLKISGHDVVELKVRDRPRMHGRSKYGFTDRILPVLVDCLYLRWLKWRRLAAREDSVKQP